MNKVKNQRTYKCPNQNRKRIKDIKTIKNMEWISVMVLICMLSKRGEFLNQFQMFRWKRMIKLFVARYSSVILV